MYESDVAHRQGTVTATLADGYQNNLAKHVLIHKCCYARWRHAEEPMKSQMLLSALWCCQVHDTCYDCMLLCPECMSA